MEKLRLEDLSQRELVKMAEVFGKNCISIDGLWFQGVEDHYGQEAAMAINEQVWRRQVVIEAHRIKKNFNLDAEGPLAVARAFNYMTGMPTMKWSIQEVGPHAVVVTLDCPMQASRVEQGRGEYPCKESWTEIYASFGRTIDPRVKMRCRFAPPDPHPPDAFCSWEFYM